MSDSGRSFFNRRRSADPAWISGSAPESIQKQGPLDIKGKTHFSRKYLHSVRKHSLPSTPTRGLSPGSPKTFKKLFPHRSGNIFAVKSSENCDSVPKENYECAMVDFMLHAFELMALDDPEVKCELEEIRSTKELLAKENSKSCSQPGVNNATPNIIRKINDMRQRLSWLKRRQEARPSVRPTPDEVQTWSSDFHNLMASKYGQSLFRAFLQREFSEENIEFWVAVEEFRNCRPAKLTQKALKIHGDYVAPKSEKEVNLDAETRTTIASNLNNPDRNIFDNAQRRVQALMESDAYQRFLQSELYKELLRPVSDSPLQ